MAYLIRHFRNEKGTGAEIRPAIVSGIATGDAAVSYWPIYFFPCGEKHSQKSSGNLIRPSFLSRSKVANEVNFTLFTPLCLSRLIEVKHESSSGNK